MNLLHLGLYLCLDHALDVLLHLHVNLGLDLPLDGFLKLLVHHILDVNVEHLLTLILSLHLVAKLLLGQSAHSLVGPEKELEAMLVVIKHVFVPVFFNCQFLAESLVDILDSVIEATCEVIN